MKTLRVLIACEESQSECIAFRDLGHEAYSCDIQDCSGGHPEWHIKGDVRPLLQSGDFDLIIAHPPCTYLTKAGSQLLFPKGNLNRERYEKGLEARKFFFECLNANAPFVAVENPIPCKIFGLPRPSTYVEPFQFGCPYTKKTLLWLKNLPPLMPTMFYPQPKSFVFSGSSSGKRRSKSFDAISRQMALQWSNFILGDYENLETF